METDPEAVSTSLHLSIRIEPTRQERYMRGGCFAFAEELRAHVLRETGISLQRWALWDDAQPHHAFLVDPSTRTAYDARGSHPLDAGAISKGSILGDGGTVGRISLATMKAWARSMDRHNARIDVRQGVTALRCGHEAA
jgi:hypothetical protein